MPNFEGNAKANYLSDMELEFENSFDPVFLTPPSEHLRSHTHSAPPTHHMSLIPKPGGFRSPENYVIGRKRTVPVGQCSMQTRVSVERAQSRWFRTLWNETQFFQNKLREGK